ncbi:hypothetical protein Tco_0802252 [Tanacetum coccineum]|uniref:Uncharacterized protein n=1 Tax=Tanacetum coccineum TaxID=301880 RepID=A0ABQ4ZY95_9ASTR
MSKSQPPPPAPPRDKNQRAFVGGSWSDSGEEDDEKIQDETCLVAQAPNEVCSESSYFSDENSSIDDLALDNEYDKLCKMSLKIITKNKRLKAIRNSLENELRELKDKLSTLEKNKGVDIDCAKCHTLKIENEKLKEESTRLNKFEKSTHCLNEMLNNQKPSGNKLGLGFNSFEASSSGTKEIKFVKAQKKTSSDGGRDLMSWHLVSLRNGPYQTNPPFIEDIIPSIRIDREGQVRRIRHEEEIDVHEYTFILVENIPPLKPFRGNHLRKRLCLGSENQEGIVAREEAVIPLLRLPPSINHTHLISTMMMTMGMTKEPSVQALLPPFVMSIP